MKNTPTILKNSKNYVGYITLKKKKTTRLNIRNIPIYLFLILLSSLVLFPFYILIINATHASDEIAIKLQVLPGHYFMKNISLLTVIDNFYTGYLSAYKNSLIISSLATLLSTLFGSLAAFGFAKYEFEGKRILFAIVILSLICPQQIFIIGFSKICDALNMMNTILPLIIPSVANSFFVFFIKHYIEASIPDSMMDSARLDGCSEFKLFTHVILPMIFPAITTMALITFISNWNSFLVPLVILDDYTYTVPIFAQYCKGIFGNGYGPIYLGIAMSIVPCLVIYPFLAKFIIRGITVGELKKEFPL